MGSIADNRVYYQQYDWSGGGVEWSAPWGGTRQMWLTSLYPRLAAYLPAGRIVEIGSGHGRIAKILHAFAREELVLYDIVESCVAACKKAFETSSKTTCLLTDGRTLPGIPSRSADLVVSFYSLVAADAETVAAYIGEFGRVLGSDGVAFLHHSNAAVYYDDDAVESDPRMPLLAAYRDVTTSARSVRDWARDCGLSCIRQECIDWDLEGVLTDCFSTFVRAGSKWEESTQVIENPDFGAERRLAATHAATARGRGRRPGRLA